MFRPTLLSIFLLVCPLFLPLEECSGAAAFRLPKLLQQLPQKLRGGGFLHELPETTLDASPSPDLSSLDNQKSLRQSIHWMIPIVSTLAAFSLFRYTAYLFHTAVRWLADITETFVPMTLAEIDLQTQVVTQVVNGPVITSISVLFATLVSTTVSTLHNRQMEMYNSFSKQVHLVNQLQTIIQHLEPSQELILHPLTQLLAKGLFQESCRELESAEMDQLIDSMICELHTFMMNPKKQPKTSPMVSHAHSVLTEIAEARRSRHATLKVNFPSMHYLTLGILAISICISFLIATDQNLQVLESIPVRLLWSILIGAFTSLAVVCYDLAAPFAGVYTVATTAVVKHGSLFA